MNSALVNHCHHWREFLFAVPFGAVRHAEGASHLYPHRVWWFHPRDGNPLDCEPRPRVKVQDLHGTNEIAITHAVADVDGAGAWVFRNQYSDEP